MTDLTIARAGLGKWGIVAQRFVILAALILYLSSTRRQEGETFGRAMSGLGLSFCFGIIEAHRGRIEIKSKEGEWTEVRVLFPLSGSGKENGNGKADIGGG